VVLAVDMLSPANESNFAGLRVLSDRLETALGPGRTGFLLGEAAVAIRLAAGGDGIALPEPVLGRDDSDRFVAALCAAPVSPAGVFLQGGGPALADADELAFAARCGRSGALPIADLFGHTMGASSLLSAVLSILAAPPPWLGERGEKAALCRALGGQLAALLPGAIQPPPHYGDVRPPAPFFSPVLRELARPAVERPDAPPQALVTVLDHPIEPPPRARAFGQLIPSAAVELTPGATAMTAARAWGYEGPTITLMGAAERALVAIANRARSRGAIAALRIESASGAVRELR